MAWINGDRISYKIIWVLMVSMVAFLVAVWALFSFAYRFAIKGVMNEYVLTSASELASEVRLHVNDDVSELRQLVGSGDFRTMEPMGLRLGITKLVAASSRGFGYAYVLDRDGEVLEFDSNNRSGDDPIGSSGVSPLPPEALRVVLRGSVYTGGWAPFVEQPMSFLSAPFWVTAVPIRGYDETVKGILLTLADAGTLQASISAKGLGETGSAYIVDRRGELLLRIGDGAEPVPTKELKAEAASQESGVTVTEGANSRVITARASLPELGWRVMVRMDEEEILAGYKRLTIIMIIGSIVFLGLLVGTSVRWINRILAPMAELKAAVEKVGAGDYETRVKVRSNDEIGILSNTFNSMVARVREAERAKTEFVSLASHELRTPLTSIKGYSSTLLRRDVEWEDSDRQEFLLTINSEADRLGRLVSDMLDVSRIDLGRLDFRMGNLDTGDLCRQVARKVAATTEIHQFTFEVAEDVPEAMGDRDRVEQILYNLYSNAIKYSPDGGRIRTRIRTSRDGGFVRVAITDQGVGIPEDKLEMVFDRFYRVHDSRTAEAGGTGLGLYITKNLVAAMGGEISVDSTPQKGSTFAFTLPVSAKSREVSA